MRHRPPKEIRDHHKSNNALADAVLRGDHDAARREALRVKEAAKRIEDRAQEFMARQGIRRG